MFAFSSGSSGCRSASISWYCRVRLVRAVQCGRSLGSGIGLACHILARLRGRRHRADRFHLLRAWYPPFILLTVARCALATYRVLLRGGGLRLSDRFARFLLSLLTLFPLAPDGIVMDNTVLVTDLVDSTTIAVPCRIRGQSLAHVRSLRHRAVHLSYIRGCHSLRSSRALVQFWGPILRDRFYLLLALYHVRIYRNKYINFLHNIIIKYARKEIKKETGASPLCRPNGDPRRQPQHHPPVHGQPSLRCHT